jgi:DNA polymerase-3 subunit gamma/tau
MAMVRLCAAQSLPPPEDAARLLRDGAPSSSRQTVPKEPRAEPPRPAPTVNIAPAPAHGLNTFEDLIALVARENIVELELALDRMKVTRFSPMGELAYVAAPEHPRDLVRHLKAFLEEHTQIEWRVRAADAPSAPVESLADRRKREEARALEELKRQPFVAEALKHFPNAEIADVRQPQDETSGGDVVQMPSQTKTAPSPARKKEADR